MSRIYFHSEYGDAELMGSERAWLSWIAGGPARAYWGLDRTTAYERAKEILAMAKRGGRGDWVFEQLARAEAEEAGNERLVAAAEAAGRSYPHDTRYDEQRKLPEHLTLAMDMQGLPLEVAGVELRSNNIELNTALAVGNEPLALAAKISGWCESHCWVDGPDREWLANIVDDGLETGVYRRGIWYEPERGAEREWSSQGWEQVAELLRSRDDGPVVLSYSVCERFPNSGIAGWTAPFDEAWKPDWAEADGLAEWEAMSTEERNEYQRNSRHDEWYDLPDEQRWQLAIDGLRNERPWAQLSPDKLFDVTFHLPVTIFDLFAPDRDERVRRAAEVVA